MADASRKGLSEELVAELARAAYQVALQHGLQGPFVDVELAIWRELARVAEIENEAAVDEGSWCREMVEAMA